MSTTVHEALLNAQINFQNLGRMGAAGNPLYMIAMEQLNNGLEAIDNGMILDDVIQEHLGADVKTDAAREGKK